MGNGGGQGVEVRVQVPGLPYQHVLGCFSLGELRGLPSFIEQAGVSGQVPARVASGTFCCPELPEGYSTMGGAVPACFLITLEAGPG